MTRSALNYDRDLVSALNGLEDFDPSRTSQADAPSADINNIVREFGLTGNLPQGVRIPTYEDYTDAVEDYQTAANALREADAAFLALPASVRSRFHNDPQAFLEYATKPENLDGLREMGLAPPPPALEPETPPLPTPGKAKNPPADPSADPSS